MKKTSICVTVDVDTLQVAKTKVENISKYVNDCLEGLGNRTTEDMKEEQLIEEQERLKELARDTAMRQSFIQQDLKLLRDAKVLAAKETLENEQFKRWICPVCKHQNFMEFVACNGCNMKTRDSKKTEIISIKGDVNDKND